MSITAAATSATGDAPGARGCWRRPGRSAISSTVHLEQLGDPLVELGGREDPAYERALAGRSRAADAGQRAEGLRGGHRVVGGAAAQQRAGVVGDVGADLLAQLAQRLVAGRPVGEVLAGQPTGAERQRPGHVGRLVVAAGDLQRAAADVEDGEPARGPPEPAAYGEEGQPGLVLAGQHLDLDAGALVARGRAPRRSCRRRGPPRSRRSRSPRSPCPPRARARGRRTR